MPYSYCQNIDPETGEHYEHDTWDDEMQCEHCNDLTYIEKELLDKIIELEERIKILEMEIKDELS